jgi:putative component of membrane protein insertase Oxa1/YidC/SpoIIIJ protein YidD
MTAAVPVSPLACWAITQYQRHVSPRKGFRCAYRALRGRDSCSQFAKRAIERHGVAEGVRLLNRRFERCRWASHVLEYDGAKRRRDRRERALWSVNGCNPTWDDPEILCCLGEAALSGGCDVASAPCH